MKVLIINTTGVEGSTGKISLGLANELIKDGHSVKILYGRGFSVDEKIECIKVASKAEVYLNVLSTRLLGMINSFAFFSTRKIVKIIDSYRPDVIQMFNLHGYYLNERKLFREISKRGIKIVYSMLDEYPYMGKCCYSNECTKFQNICSECPSLREYPASLFFDKAKAVQEMKATAYEANAISFTGPKWVIERARLSSLLRDKNLYEIDEPIDTFGRFMPQNVENIFKKYNVPTEKLLVLNVAVFSNQRKGVKYFLEAARACKRGDLLFINVGYDGPKDDLPENFLPISYVSNQDELACFYSLADLYCCTSTADTMPNACLEALSCGTPICAFNISGIPYIADDTVMTLVEPKNSLCLLDVILKANKKTEEDIKKCREYALSRYSYKIFEEKLIEIYNE